MFKLSEFKCKSGECVSSNNVLEINNDCKIKGIAIKKINKLLKPLEEVLSNRICQNTSLDGSSFPKMTGKIFSMAGLRRLHNMKFLFLYQLERGLNLDFIETGVWRGGICLYIKYLFELYDIKNKIYLADSFKGFPRNNMKILQENSVEIVETNFKDMDLYDENLEFLVGWFNETLPKIDKDKKFSIIRLDGDLYESTLDALNSLYHKLEKGGFLMLDDFIGWAQCQKATRDFFRNLNIDPIMTMVDHKAKDKVMGVWILKE